jgi:hypothetical protein
VRRPDPLRHDARRDTAWVGKGSGWLTVAGVTVAAVLLAVLLHR